MNKKSIILIQDMQRRLFLALCDSRKKGKELINSVLKDLEELRKIEEAKDGNNGST